MKETLTVQRDLVFGHTDLGVALTADIYLPGIQGPRPGLLLIHGGAWTKGSKEAYQEWGPVLAQAGFVAMAVNYRLSSVNYVGWPGALEDVRQAFHWMVDHARSFQIDPQRIGVIGDSAGGQLAALLTLTYYIDPLSGTDATIRAHVGAYAAYDLTPGKGKQENYLLERPDHALEHFMGAAFQQAPEACRSASPMNYIAQAKTNPQFNTRFLLTWGDADTMVAPYIEEEFARRLQQAGKQVQTVVIPGYDHFWFVPSLLEKAEHCKNTRIHWLQPRYSNFCVRHSDAGSYISTAPFIRI